MTLSRASRADVQRGARAALLAATLLIPSLASAQPPAASRDAPSVLAAPAPCRGLVAADAPNDAGRTIRLSWTLSPDDRSGEDRVRRYALERSESPTGPWSAVDSVGWGVDRHDDAVVRGREYFYRVVAVGPGGAAPSAVVGPVAARSEWINSTRWSVLIFTVAFFAFVLYYTASAQAGKELFVRRIPGIDAIEEAIGRATEMGRPVLYVPGIQDVSEMQTIAALVILESVARLTARYETPILVPVTYPIPFAIAEEMVKSGYLHAGHPERYDPDSVRFVSPEQFAYVAAVTGIMHRERPAAHLYLGAFYAESLMLAETGHATGAIQVAGTANVHQLPFFVVACDHTLIGEELYAASAYLSREPRLLGGLKGADFMKVAVIVLILVGCALESVGVHTLTEWMRTQ